MMLKVLKKMIIVSTVAGIAFLTGCIWGAEQAVMPAEDKNARIKRQKLKERARNLIKANYSVWEQVKRCKPWDGQIMY